MDIDVFGQTDIGKKRGNNEDSFLCLSLRNNQQPEIFIAVADGMGGHTGGEVASAIAVETIKKNALAQFEGPKIPEMELPTLLKDWVQKANHEIFQKASHDKGLSGMGSTLVTALISSNEAYVSNVGDSRAYLIRKKTIQQITLDHNWKNEQMQKGDLTEDDIKNSPYKDLITRSLGLNLEAEVDIYEFEPNEGDYVLLCSDGLHSLLSEKDILKIFKKTKDIRTICQKLIDAANKLGGHDNITVVIAHLNSESEMKRASLDTIKLNIDDK